MTLYAQLASDIEQMITGGILRAGERLPSVRSLRERRALSQATVLQAYALLERRGLIRSRPRSGYFVCPRAVLQRSVPTDALTVGADLVDVSSLVFDILGATRERRLLPLGSAFPSPLLFPLDALAQSLARSARRFDPWASVTDLPPGSIALRRAIAKRYRGLGMHIPLDGILITNGAIEALNLCLQAVAPPGSVVAIESPAFYGALQAIERLGLRAVEVRTDRAEGVDPDHLRAVLDRHPVRACWFMSSFQNPLGCSVPDTNRAQIVQLLAERDIALIEDDVYAELYYGTRAPRPYKSFDQSGGVLHCSGFSKSLAPGYRVGWTAAGRYAPAVERLKLGSSIATSIPAQEALADYLERGGFDAHLRRLRKALARQQSELLSAVAEHFPAGTRATPAAGGYFSWIELPPGSDSIELHRRASLQGIGLSPGPMFSARRAYAHCLRLNHGHPWTDALTEGTRRLGQLACELQAR